MPFRNYRFNFEFRVETRFHDMMAQTQTQEKELRIG